jgi:hypothetical protein
MVIKTTIAFSDEKKLINCIDKRLHQYGTDVNSSKWYEIVSACKVVESTGGVLVVREKYKKQEIENDNIYD